jgi:serine/threonine protein phosphatase 1
MSKYFVVSDVHGFLDELIAALAEKGFEKDNPEHKLVVCGDLFDRGPKAVELFEFVKGLGDRFIYVRGNHEDLLFDCYNDLIWHVYLGRHHISNGTVDTICQFTGLNMYEAMSYSEKRDELLDAKILPLIYWMNEKSVNYFEIGKYICVHGWLPRLRHTNDFKKARMIDWDKARWTNGMEAWRNPENRVDGKTIICGHWHCSWGWSHIRQKRKEFPQKSKKDWLKSFEPFVDDGIIAIDSCVAYTGVINCIVLEG